MDPKELTTPSSPSIKMGENMTIRDSDENNDEDDAYDVSINVIRDSDDDDEDDEYDDPIIDVKDVRATARNYLELHDWKVKGTEVNELMLALTMGCGCNNGPIPTCPLSWKLTQDDFEDLYNMVKMARKKGIEEDTITERVVECLEMRLHRPLFRLGLVKLVEDFI